MATAIPALTTLTNATVASATDVGGNFTSIRNTVNADVLWLTKTGQTMTQTMTWSALQTFSVGLTVSASGITVTGNSTITGTLSAVTTLTATSGGFTTLTGAVEFDGNPVFSGTPNFTGTPTFADITVTGTATLAAWTPAAAGTIVSGATSFAIRDNTNTYSLLGYTVSTQALGITSPKGLTLTATGAGDISLLAGSSGNVYLGKTTLGAHVGYAIIGGVAGVPGDGPPDGALVVDTTNKTFNVRIGGFWYGVALS